MTAIQIIELDGRPAAIVAGEQAIIPAQLTGHAREHVAAKALYALQIASGEVCGPLHRRRRRGVRARSRCATPARDVGAGAQPAPSAASPAAVAGASREARYHLGRRGAAPPAGLQRLRTQLRTAWRARRR
jgi:hypothetical protein